MPKISLSENEISVETIWNWYEDQKEALRDYKYKFNKTIINNSFLE